MRVSAIAIIAALSLAAPAAAAPPELVQLRDLMARGQQALDEGRMDDAYDLLNEGVGLAYDHQIDGDPPEEWIVSLLFARYFRENRNWAKIEQYAGSAATGLDPEDYGILPERNEAMMLFGEAVSEQGRYAEAEPILQAALQAAQAQGQTRVAQRALYMLAETRAQLLRPDTLDWIARVKDLHAAGGAVEDAELAYLMSKEIEILRSRDGQQGKVLEVAQALEAFMQSTDQIAYFDNAIYLGLIGLGYAETGNVEKALELFLREEELLAGKEPFRDRYFVNGQRIAVMHYNLGDEAAALSTLNRYIAEAEDTGFDSARVVALLYRDVGNIGAQSGKPVIAQTYFRKAYAVARRGLSANHPTVLEIKGKIDVQAEGMAAFALRSEFGLVDDLAFEWRDDGADTMRLFFSGSYVALDQVLQLEDAPSLSSYYLNRGLYHALMGHYDKTGRFLGAAVENGADPVVADLVQAVAQIWGSHHELELLDPLMRRLEAAQPQMSRDQRSSYMALAAFRHFLEGRTGPARAGLRRWMQSQPDGFDPTPWDAFAGLMADEMVIDLLNPTEGQAMFDQLQVRMNGYEGLVLAQAITDFVRERMRDTWTPSEEGAVRMGAIVQNMRSLVPADHVLQVSAHFSFAIAMWNRGFHDDAFQAIDTAIEAYQQNPFHRRDTLAMLQANKGNWLSQNGKLELGLSLARQAFLGLDLEKDDPNRVHDVANNLIFSLRNWGEWEQALEVSETVIWSPRLMGQVPATLRSNALVTYGSTLLGLDRHDEARAAYLAAEQALPDDLEVADSYRAMILYELSIVDYRQQDYDDAFDHVVRSNDAFFGFTERMSRNLGAEASVNAEAALTRARAEALLGWDYAQTLAPKARQEHRTGGRDQ